MPPWKRFPITNSAPARRLATRTERGEVVAVVRVADDDETPAGDLYAGAQRVA
jgi:hypothetical protein